MHRTKFESAVGKYQKSVLARYISSQLYHRGEKKILRLLGGIELEIEFEKMSEKVERIRKEMKTVEKSDPARWWELSKQEVKLYDKYDRMFKRFYGM